VKSDTAIDVAPGALQWKVLKLGHPERAHAGWTDPVPGRIKIDERLAAKVGSPLAGRVSEVMVDLGQQVKAGDPLFRVSSPDVADLRAQARKAEVDYQAARVVFERTHAMVDAHAHAATDGDQVTDSFVVTAPRDGVVVEKTLVAHQSVSPDAGNTLIAVADLSSVWVVADLFEADAVDIREGAVAKITSSNASSGPIEGRVDAVSAIVDPGRHTVPIRVSVPNTDGKLRPNAYATVQFATAADAQALSLPSTAIVTDGAKQYVYVWGNEKTFTRRDVVVGASASGRTTVLKGLSESETVLVEGGILLDNQIQLQGQG
jgi:multidrug efflux pump subunit AcrA (membrane-fusion protein)